MEALLNVEEAAQLLNVSASFVYKAAGKTIPALRLGAAVRFRPQALADYVAGLEKAQAEAEAARPTRRRGRRPQRKEL